MKTAPVELRPPGMARHPWQTRRLRVTVRKCHKRKLRTHLPMTTMQPERPATAAEKSTNPDLLKDPEAKHVPPPPALAAAHRRRACQGGAIRPERIPLAWKIERGRQEAPILVLV